MDTEKIAARLVDTGIEDQVKEIARLQEEIRRVSDEAGAKVEKLGADSAPLEESLARLARDPEVARRIAGALKKYQVNTGDLSSRLVDMVERSSAKVYPPTWPVQKSRYAVIER